MSHIISRNPATGAKIQEIPATPISDLPDIFQRAKEAQIHWKETPLKQRAQYFYHLRETILNQTDEIVDLIASETGKPKFEALANEVLPTLDALTYFARSGPRMLKDRSLSTGWMIHRKSYLNYWPIGVVVIICPWNYPFVIPMTQILMAILSGNAVIFKPSEITSSVGLKIQELCDEIGLSQSLVQTVIGKEALGSALIENRPGKIFFTGGVETGKKIMAAAAQHLTPLVLELGGKDPMIVMPDADLDFATSVALWGGFSNSGQMCASTERLLLHERIAEPFIKLLKEKMKSLRHITSDSPVGDLGVLTTQKQISVLEHQLADAKAKGAIILEGGEWTEDRKTLKPTLVSGSSTQSMEIFETESFGPVIAVSTFKTIKEAIKKANQSKYGLSASIISKNLTLSEEMGRQIETGTVTLNEVAYTYGLPQTPWGGVKESGIGRSHSFIGLHEFVNVRHIHKPRFGAFAFTKALWWYPYSETQYEAFRYLIQMYRQSWIEKFRALSDFLLQVVQLLKSEPRL